MIELVDFLNIFDAVMLVPREVEGLMVNQVMQSAIVADLGHHLSHLGNCILGQGPVGNKITNRCLV